MYIYILTDLLGDAMSFPMTDHDSQMPKSLLDLTETLLNAQLSAIGKLRRQFYPDDLPRSKRGRKPSGMSQLDLVFDILSHSREPLHVSEIIRRGKQSHGVELDRESLVSALSKRVMRGDRFVRSAPNTFALIEHPQTPKTPKTPRGSASGASKGTSPAKRKKSNRPNNR